MKDFAQIREILIYHKPLLLKKYPLKAIGIFGSITRNRQTSKSDIDILVEFKKPVGVEFIDLAEELEKILDVKVYLVSKKGVKPGYLKSIEKELTYV